MGFQFVFTAASTKAEYVNDSYIKILQLNTHFENTLNTSFSFLIR